MAKSKARSMETDTDATEDAIGGLLNKNWAAMPKKQLLPLGDWKYQHKGAGKFTPGKEGGSDRVTFVLVAKEPMENVDEDAIAELGDNYDYSLNTIFHTVFVGEAADWERVREVLEASGVELDGSIADSLKAVKGKSVVAYTKVNTRTDNRTGADIVENVLSGFKPVE